MAPPQTFRVSIIVDISFLILPRDLIETLIRVRVYIKISRSEKPKKCVNQIREWNE